MTTKDIGFQTGYRWVCVFHRWTLGFSQSGLAVLRRRYRATSYPSSVAPRFTTMLLSPRPFGSRLGVHLGVIYPERRSPLVTILSVRTTAHSLPAHGAPPILPISQAHQLRLSLRFSGKGSLNCDDVSHTSTLAIYE